MKQGHRPLPLTFERRHAITAALVVACALSATGADSSAKPAVPESYPKVILSSRSSPRYAVIEMDSLKPQHAYLLFDGNVTNGYKRMFIWSPGHSKYGSERVKSQHVDGETGRFPGFKTESSVGKEGSMTSWTFKYQAETHGQTHTDYKTGVTTTNEDLLLPRFYFTVDLKRGPARRAERKGGKYPLDIGIDGRLRIADAWENLPPLAEPWKNVYCNISREPHHGAKRGYLRCKGHLRYWYDRYSSAVAVRSLPDDSRVHLEIAPYLEEPVFSKELGVDQIFLNHIDIDIPYGWYRTLWTFKSEFFEARGLNGNSDDWPFAFRPPSPK